MGLERDTLSKVLEICTPIGIWKIGERGNIKGTATLKVAAYTEKTSNACAPNVQLNYLKQK